MPAERQASLRRFHLMLSNVLETILEGKTNRAAAQLVC